MATRIRLRRMGSNKRPFYRVVVADQRSPRDGRFIEIIGKYHPLNDPSVIEIDEDRALHWLMVGAQPSNQVRNLMTKVGIWDRFVAERPNAAVVVSTTSDGWRRGSGLDRALPPTPVSRRTTTDGGQPDPGDERGPPSSFVVVETTGSAEGVRAATRCR